MALPCSSPQPTVLLCGYLWPTHRGPSIMAICGQLMVALPHVDLWPTHGGPSIMAICGQLMVALPSWLSVANSWWTSLMMPYGPALGGPSIMATSGQLLVARGPHGDLWPISWWPLHHGSLWPTRDSL